jgi:hypothetical protein
MKLYSKPTIIKTHNLRQSGKNKDKDDIQRCNGW